MTNFPISIFCPFCQRHTSLTVAPGRSSRRDCSPLAIWDVGDNLNTACIDKGANKDKLVDQLHELASNRTITEDLKEWADVVRWVGNDAAHPNKENVSKDDAEDILKLAEQFLHVNRIFSYGSTELHITAP